jgi:hypothetical protein
MAWIDVCDADMSSAAEPPVRVARIAILPDRIVVGSRNFNGAVGALPISFEVNGVEKARLDANGDLHVTGRVYAAEFIGSGAPGVPSPVLSLPCSAVPIADTCPSPKAISAVGSVSVGVNGLVLGGATALNVAASPDFNFGGGNFSVSFDIVSSSSQRQDIISQNNLYSAANWWGLIGNVGGTGRLGWYENANLRIAASVPWDDGRLHQVKIERIAGVVTLTFDGSVVGSYVSSFQYGKSSVGLRIGSNPVAGVGYFVVGAMRNICVQRG